MSESAVHAATRKLKNKSAVILAVLCGLPASGKSHLCQLLRNGDDNPCTVNGPCDKHRQSTPEIQYVIVCYDLLIGDPFHGQNVAETLQWKSARRCIVVAVDQIIGQLTGVPELASPGDDSPISKATVDEFKSKIEEQNSAPTGVPRGTDTVIVIDDNMYYRSMRKEYFQLARKHGLGFCQIYLKCSVSVALRRDRCRPNRVGDDVIRNMHLKMEKPDEENLASGGTEQTFVVDTGRDNLQFCRCDLLSHFEEAFRNPVPPLHEEEDETMLATRETSVNNVLHQADQGMRKIISDLMRDRRGTLSSSQLRAEATRLNAKRQSVLDDIRGERLAVPADIRSAIADGSLDHVRPRLNSFLREIILCEVTSINQARFD